MNTIVPVISIIMPAYNAEQTIAETIESILMQTYTYWELIVVDDGSTDATRDIIMRFALNDARIKYLYQQNSKQGKARNSGIAEAAGNLIAFIDADDLWMKDKLEKQLAFINKTNADIVFSDVITINEKGIQQSGTWHVKDKFYQGESGLLSFISENKVPLLSVLAKKQSIVAVNGFFESPDVNYGEDYDLWLRMLQNNALFAASSEKLAAYRLHESHYINRRKHMLDVIEILKRVTIANHTLTGQKNEAIKLWIRRFVKTCLPAITKKELQRIISLFPLATERFLFSFINSIAGSYLSAKLILLYLSGMAKKNLIR